MTFDDIHPRGGADQICTEFGLLAAALDRAEHTAGNRPGGPTAADSAATHLLELRLHRLRPESVQDWRWAAGRVGRALINGWDPEAVAPLVRWCGG